jgi:nucleoside-diphosphate-sugar epimerase
MATKTISVLGCGWLGWPLAKTCLAEGYKVRGSTTATEKWERLTADGVDAYLIQADPSGLTGERVESFFQADTLFLNIPFRRNLPEPHMYAEQILSVVDRVLASPIRFVIFASSTSVYPCHNQTASEEDIIIPDNERSQVLLDIEDMLLKQREFDTTVLRFAGLYGGERRIGRFRSGQSELPGGHNPVNLVHLDDCVEIVRRVIAENIRGEVFNICSDGHPSRKVLYTAAAESLQVPPPAFASESAPGKTVSNAKIKKRLRYAFRHADPMKDI